MSEREKLAVEKFNELYKDGKIPENIANSDLYNIVNNLVYGEIYQQGQLTDKDRELISLVALTTLGTNTLLKTHVYSALNSGLTPVEIIPLPSARIPDLRRSLQGRFQQYRIHAARLLQFHHSHTAPGRIHRFFPVLSLLQTRLLLWKGRCSSALQGHLRTCICSYP